MLAHHNIYVLREPTESRVVSISLILEYSKPSQTNHSSPAASP